MMYYSTKFGVATRHLSLQIFRNRSTTKLADTLVATEERKCVSTNSNDMISKKCNIYNSLSYQIINNFHEQTFIN